MDIVDACQAGDCDRVLALFDAGEDVDYHYCNDWTLLQFAILNADIDMITLLVKLGVDVNFRGSMGYTSLQATVLWLGVSESDIWKTISMMKILIAGGVNLNSQDPVTGITILHYIVHMREYINVIQLLLDSGADPEIRNVDGQTPLDLAEDDDVITLLQEYIASRNVKNAGRRK